MTANTEVETISRDITVRTVQGLEPEDQHHDYTKNGDMMSTLKLIHLIFY